MPHYTSKVKCEKNLSICKKEFPGLGCTRFLKFGHFSCELKETGSSGATESEVWIGDFNVKARKTIEHKLHKIWRSLKFCKISGKRAHPRGAPGMGWGANSKEREWVMGANLLFGRIKMKKIGSPVPPVREATVWSKRCNRYLFRIRLFSVYKVWTNHIRQIWKKKNFEFKV